MRLPSSLRQKCWLSIGFLIHPQLPGFGGFYERLVGVVKLPLKKVIGKAMLSLYELQTVLCKIGCVVNRRPLMHMGGINDESPLTPAKLTGSVWSSDLMSAEIAVHHSGLTNLSKRAKYLQMVQKRLHQRRKREYLTSLKACSTRASRHR